MPCDFLYFYRGVFTAVGIIYREQGIKGFFCGLIPRLLCDLTALWLGKTLAHIINNYLLEDRDLKQYVSASMNVSILMSLYMPCGSTKSVGLIRKQDVKKMPGCDGVSVWILKECRDQVTCKIQRMVVDSLDEVPLNWKPASIVLI